MDATEPDAKVIVVAPDPKLLACICQVLRPAGLAVEAYESAEALLDNDELSRADCLIVGPALPGMSGLELQETLRARGWRVPIIFVGNCAKIRCVVEAMKGGADDYLSEPIQQDDLLRSVRSAVKTGRTLRRLDQEHAVLISRLQRLTHREQEVLELLCQGKSTKQIASQFGVCIQTAWRHGNRALKKLDVEDQVDLVRLCARHSWLRSLSARED